MKTYIESLNTKAKRVRHLVAALSALLVALNAGFQLGTQVLQLLGKEDNTQHLTQTPRPQQLTER